MLTQDFKRKYERNCVIKKFSLKTSRMSWKHFKCVQPPVHSSYWLETYHFLLTAKRLIHSNTTFLTVPIVSFSIPELPVRVLPHFMTRILLQGLEMRVHYETCLLHHWSPFSNAAFHHEIKKHATVLSKDTLFFNKNPGQCSSIAAGIGLCSEAFQEHLNAI